MNVVDTIYSLAVVKDLSDEELYQRLFEAWNITNGKIEVWGELKANPRNGFIKLKNIKTLSENREISYPLSVMHNVESGLYILQEYAKKTIQEQSSSWVKCCLELSPLVERLKRNNPFELSVNIDSVQRLISMPIAKDDIIESDDTSYLSKKVYDFHLAQVSEALEEKQKELEVELLLNYRAKELEQEDKQSAIDENQSAMEHKLQKSTDLLSEKLDELEKSEVEYSKISNDVVKLEKKSTHLEININIQQQALVELTHEYKKVEEEMSQKISKLKNYISDKAAFLKDFEFIDEEDFDSFILNVASESVTQDGISFQEVLGGDYAKAVSYIQAYLKEQGIFYPRHIVENYLTLIRSNDLIILAGDSGSGKTKLVESFAEAVGGVSKVIPVKPNWTSSEDLLGYYNPLEKKYLATPFLEALIEAQQSPDIPYFICLDEMNLARVEYYFADFLSKLEARDTTPRIQLYSDNESAHVLSELKAVVSIISDAKDKFGKEGVVDFVKLMQDEDVNAEMKRAFGFSDKDSLIKYHGDIRRLLSGVINTPSVIEIPANVRIIGTINIDETTHYLSPKILDRAHIMKFKSPLLTDWDDIFSEIEDYGFDDVSKPIIFKTEELGQRAAYPKFDRSDTFCDLFVDLNKVFFDRLDVEFGMRTVRQGLNYIALFAELNDNSEQAINNFIIHKVLPKFTFDGNKQSGDLNKIDLLDKGFLPRLESIITSHESLPVEFSSIAALKNIISNAKANDGVVNYWA
jgi:hypothetical protein